MSRLLPGGDRRHRGGRGRVILALIAGTMMPEAFEVAHDYAGLVTAGGFLAAFLLSKLGGLPCREGLRAGVPARRGLSTWYRRRRWTHPGHYPA